MRLIPAITAAAALALTACSTNSVTISYEGGKTRVEAYSENILRVTSVPEGADFIDGKSLMALKPQRKIKINVTKDDSATTVKAPGITAVVDNSDGRVSFFLLRAAKPDESQKKMAALKIKAAEGDILGMKSDCSAAAFFLFCRWADL